MPPSRLALVEKNFFYSRAAITPESCGILNSLALPVRGIGLSDLSPNKMARKWPTTYCVG